MKAVAREQDRIKAAEARRRQNQKAKGSASSPSKGKRSPARSKRRAGAWSAGAGAGHVLGNDASAAAAAAAPASPAARPLKRARNAQAAAAAAASRTGHGNVATLSSKPQASPRRATGNGGTRGASVNIFDEALELIQANKQQKEARGVQDRVRVRVAGVAALGAMGTNMAGIDTTGVDEGVRSLQRVANKTVAKQYDITRATAREAAARAGSFTRHPISAVRTLGKQDERRHYACTLTTATATATARLRRGQRGQGALSKARKSIHGRGCGGQPGPQHNHCCAQACVPAAARCEWSTTMS